MTIYGKGIKIKDNVENYNIKDYVYFKKHIEDNINNYIYSKNDDEMLSELDRFTCGDVSYLIDILNKYKNAKENGDIKKTPNGYVNNNSAQKWLRENDTKQILSYDYEGYLYYYAFGHEITSLDKFRDKYGNCDYELIYGLYNSMIKKIVSNEKLHFEKNDEKQIKINNLKRMINSDIFFDEHYDFVKQVSECRDIKETMNINDELIDDLTNAYEKMYSEIQEIKINTSKEIEKLKNKTYL